VADYSKRPIWQWIAIYAVVGVVIYGAVYLFFFNKSGYNTAPATSTTEVNPTLIEAQKRGEQVSVFLTPSGFVPVALIVKAGTTVSWLNQSGVTGNVSSAPHPTHTAYPPLNLGNFEAGKSISLTFNTPGTYKYHNHLTPSQSGSITVK